MVRNEVGRTFKTEGHRRSESGDLEMGVEYSEKCRRGRRLRGRTLERRRIPLQNREQKVNRKLIKKITQI